jgi:predicted PurR-regulated permease PerM
MLLGLLLGLMNIVPYLGNIVGLPAIGALALFGDGGGGGKLGTVALIFLVVQSLDAYFITPRIIGNRTGLNAFVVIFSLFFWSSVIGGALGMVLAIPLSAFIAVFWQLLVREYLAPAAGREAEDETGGGGGE